MEAPMKVWDPNGTSKVSPMDRITINKHNKISLTAPFQRLLKCYKFHADCCSAHCVWFFHRSAASATKRRWFVSTVREMSGNYRCMGTEGSHFEVEMLNLRLSFDFYVCLNVCRLEFCPNLFDQALIWLAGAEPTVQTGAHTGFS